MRLLLELIIDWLMPERRQRRASRVGPDLYLRPLLILCIVFFCGPEVFAAADLIALLDLLGAVLFLTAFAVGYAYLGSAVFARVRSFFLPGEWTVFLKASRRASLVAHGCQLIGLNAMHFLVTFAVIVAGLAEVARITA